MDGFEFSRRALLTGAGAGLAGLALPGVAGARGSGATVAVLGGGVAGMTAAHELAERGFAVTVYERRALGGKCRSMPVPGTGQDGRPDLPGEHGFRIFFGFYQDLPDTLRRIPFPGNANGVHDNLVSATEFLASFAGGREDLRIPLALPGLVEQLAPDALLRQVRAAVETVLHLPPHEAAVFAQRMLVYLTSCEERRLDQWEHTPWPEFLRAHGKSEDYKRFFVDGPTRVLAATRTDNASTHTAGLVLERLVFALLGRGTEGPLDRVLNAPTNEAWIDPWERHLRALGVEFRIGWAVEDLVVDRGRISTARVRDPDGRTEEAAADFYVCALPVEHARRVWNEDLLAADPRLRAAATLETRWMVGLMLYFDRPTPLVHGHVYYLHAPWALTSISQAAFWPERDFRADYGDGTVADCVSVIISDWDTPGVLFGRPAKQLTEEQLVQEVLTQLKQHLNDSGRTVLDESSLVTWFLDPGVSGLGGPNPANADELVVHPVGSWHRRPTARTAVPNLFLAGDYLQVPINGASMEGANSSARLAVNALLDENGSSAPRAVVRDLYRAPEFELLKAQDQVNYRLGLPNTFDILPSAL
ncbi:MULTISPECIES: hydroxysqualene dehydroxylase [Saccharothrix]|uniref:hydroxysqualene dehydroxylase n=1 Tax=Saccharothrix TaxID=2071 RepID=UPI00093974DE|nr:FAD-dependent oxidoreductase [Saccharothrix sp. CB00851]OKI16242.1 FAD-dependent oxidoreductase [Saccharothrix sp. CB00851]